MGEVERKTFNMTADKNQDKCDKMFRIHWCLVQNAFRLPFKAIV